MKLLEENLESKIDQGYSSALEFGGEIILNDERGVRVGMMRPITERHLDDVDLIEKITNWRNAHMANFLSHFVATPDRTRAWLKNVVLKSNGQILWLIYDGDAHLAGHFGFKDLNSESVMLDNAIRGERVGHPKLFVIAGQALVAWLWQNTSVKKICTIILSKNIPAIMMNRQIGFTQSKRLPLLLVEDGEEGRRFSLGEDGFDSPSNDYCYKMWIERNCDQKKVA